MISNAPPVLLCELLRVSYDLNQLRTWASDFADARDNSLLGIVVGKNAIELRNPAESRQKSLLRLIRSYQHTG